MMSSHNLTNQHTTSKDYGKLANVKQYREFEDLVKPHIESFNYAIDETLSAIAQSLPSLEFEGPGREKLAIVIENAKVSVPMYMEFNKKRDTLGFSSRLLPSDCRLRGVSYVGKLTISWCVSENGVICFQDSRVVAEVPIMIKSTKCHLNGLNAKKLVEAHEEAQEVGGYFIINGNEKFIRMLIVTRRNYPIALIRPNWKKRGPLFTDKGVMIRCVAPDYTNCLMTLHYLNNGSCILSLTNVLFIPLIYILKALINTTDHYIYQQLIASSPNDTYMQACVCAMLRSALMEDLTTQDKILKYIGSRYRYKSGVPNWYTDLEVGKTFLLDEVCVHLNRPMDKFRLLVEMTAKLYAFVQSKVSPESVDSPMLQEIMLPGDIYMLVLRSSLKSWQRVFKSELDRNIKVNKLNATRDNWDKITKGIKQKGINVSIITSRMNYFLATGNVSRDVSGLPQHKGLCLIAERLNFHRFISHFRSVHRGQFFTEMRTTSVRKLLPEAWGFLCPVHTPDGIPCGLLNHLSAQCEVTTTPSNTKTIPEILIQYGTRALSEIVSLDSAADQLPVMLDGKVIGKCSYQAALMIVAKLRELKVSKSRDVPDTLEICLLPLQEGSVYPGMYLFSDAGRMMRPLVNLQHQQKTELIGTFEQVYLQVAVNENEANQTKATHMELNEIGLLSVLASLTPFSDLNQSPRNMYQCQMSKQTMGTPCHAFPYRGDNKLYRLITPQNPIVRPYSYDKYHMEEYPQGINSIVAVISYTGYDMEDAMILNKSSVERGFAHGSIYKTEYINLVKKNRNMSDGSNLNFGINQSSPMTQASKLMEPDGLPQVGNFLKPGMPYYAYFDTTTGKQHVERYSGDEDAIVEKVRVLGTERIAESGVQSISVTLRTPRNPSIGDKFSSRYGQKGICSRLWPTEDMPFSDSGIVPDILFNPHGFPSRMTIGMLVESLAAKAGGALGRSYDATPFTFTEEKPAVDFFQNELKSAGFNYYGNERMYSGISGKEFEADIFIGPIYYQRLRHMVSDKYQVRTTGPINPVTHQPVHGRKRDGGMRFGEMERDALLSHGASFLLQDRLLNCSDKAFTHVCCKCGSILSPLYVKDNVNQIKQESMKISSYMDELESLKSYQDVNARKWVCQVCEDSGDISLIAIPYVFNLLIAELACMNIKVALDLK